MAVASTPGWGRLLAVIALAYCLLAILRLIWTRDPAALGGAAYAAVGLAAGIDTWSDPLAYFRVMAGAVVLVFMSWAGVRDRAGTAAVALSAVAGVAALAMLLPQL